MADYSLDYRIEHDIRAGSCSIRFRCFDTPNSVTVYGGGGPLRVDAAEDVLVRIRRACLELHRLWSFSLAHSDVARINSARSSVSVHDHTARLIAAMRRFHDEEPHFDYTVGPVSYLWKQAVRKPDEQEVAEALRHVGVRKLSLCGGIVEKSDPKAQVDVGGAAKGYAADLAASMIRLGGFSSADVDFGGNLFMVGTHPAGRPWRVSVRIPEGVEAAPIVLELADEAAVTSGSYERFVEIGGVRYHHIIDPATGYPAQSDIVSATVVAKSALQADLLATTACLLGSSELEGLARRHCGCRFVAITRDSRVLRL